jgi:hypothetical protein
MQDAISLEFTTDADIRSQDLSISPHMYIPLVPQAQKCQIVIKFSRQVVRSPALCM